MKTVKIELAGWNYTIEVDVAGKIFRIACERRFPLTDPKWIGDEWLVKTLQSKVDRLLDD